MRVPTYGWWMVAALAVTSTAGHGVLTYAFAVLLVPMQEALGANRTAVTGAQTVALLAAALAAVPAGRWLDRWGGRGLMIGCSVPARRRNGKPEPNCPAEANTRPGQPPPCARERCSQIAA
jgi:hypothetical protein